MNLILRSLITLALVIISGQMIAQCKGYTKRKCLPNLAPYVQNGQLTAAVLYPGDTAAVQLTFFSGQEYRLLVCHEDQLGDVHYTVADKNNKILFEKTESEVTPFDFQVQSTQQLIITVNVPPSKTTHDLNHMGCVTILVGFKNKAKEVSEE